MLFHRFDDLLGHFSIRFSESRIFDDFNAQEKSSTTDVTDPRESLLELVELFQQEAADFQGVLLKLFFLDDIQHCHADRARYRIAAKRIEVFHAVVERVSNFTGGHHSGQGVPVANRFS